MIDSITFKFGTTPGASEHLMLSVAPITVFVGPNNSGKSRVLVEIEKFCRAGWSQSHDVILEKLTFSPYSAEEFEKEIERIKATPTKNENIQPDHVLLEKLMPGKNSVFRQQLPYRQMIDEAVSPDRPRLHYFNQFLSAYTLRLDASNRVSLLQELDVGDLQLTPRNHLAYLFNNNATRLELRRIIHEAFGKYVVVDPTKVGKLRVRLSDRPPENESEERGWDARAVKFHGEAVPIDDFSDGVKAFTGILSMLLAGDPRVFLLDEPEAFLHPSLSNKLGYEIGRQLVQAGRKRLFASTHSAHFLMGCIQSGSPLNVLRLTYQNSVATVRVLEPSRLLQLMRNPLLRSTGVLQGLFYESVVVTESDADRAFYNEINERLLAAHDPRAIRNCLFLNAQNKQTVWDIVRPLRELGIPTVGVVDIDVLKEGGQVWGKPMYGAYIPEAMSGSLNHLRQQMLKAFQASGKCMKRDGGVALLGHQDRQACNSLFDDLAKFGVFVVRGGELESWLPSLHCSGHGPNWLIAIFEAMGTSDQDAGYLVPQSGDVWDFIGDLKKWLTDPERLGMPT